MKRLPRGPFSTVYADPAWEYLTYAGGTVPHRGKDGAPYDVLPLSVLKTIPVESVVTRDACLVMWILGSHVDQGIDLARAWGFKYCTDLFVWDKAGRINKKTGLWEPTNRIGFGKWSRKQTETAYLFTRGDPSPLPGSRGVKQLIRAPRREHSRKPDEAGDRIEKLCPGPYLEMFARTTRPGWKVWGLETTKFESVKEAA